MSRLIEALGKLDALSGSLAERIGKTKVLNASSSIADSTRKPPPPPPLPPIPSIREDLQAIGLSSELVDRLVGVYNKEARELQKVSEENWNKLSIRLTALPSNTLIDPLGGKILERRASLYLQNFTRGVEEYARETVRRGQELRSLEIQMFNGPQYPRFQTTFRPLLEDYFTMESNPTREDKEILAHKTGMNYRQIHVWFQNRRARARREGETLNHRPQNRFQPFRALLDKQASVRPHIHKNHQAASTEDRSTCVDIARGSTSVTTGPIPARDNLLDCPDSHLPGAVTLLRFSRGSSSTKLDNLTPERKHSSGLRPRLPFQSVIPKSFDLQQTGTSLQHSFLAVNLELISENSDTHVTEPHRTIYHKEIDVLRILLERNRSGTTAFRNVSGTSITALRSFSQAFESHETVVLGLSDKDNVSYSFPPPAKKRRIIEHEVSSPLMSLAKICSATSPIRSKPPFLPERLPTAVDITHQELPEPVSPSSAATSPLTSIESPPSSPSSSLSRAPSFESDFSDNLFSGSSISSTSEPNTPALLSAALPDSFSAHTLTDPTSAPSISLEMMSSADLHTHAYDCVSPNHNPCSTSLPQHIPQVVRKVVPNKTNFDSSSAINMLRLEF